MSKRIETLLLTHTKLLTDIGTAITNLREQGKVWANGSDTAIQLQTENLDLEGSVFCFTDDCESIEVWDIEEFRQGGRAESEPKTYSLSRCNLNDLIDLVAVLETYGTDSIQKALAE